MHSSRMRPSAAVAGGGGVGRVYLSTHWAGGCVSQHALGRGVSAQGGLSVQGGVCPGGVCPGCLSRGCQPGGVSAPVHARIHPHGQDYMQTRMHSRSPVMTTKYQ